MEFGSLEQFPLAWRWTSPEQHPLGGDDLADIRPLTPSTAKQLAATAVDRCSDASVRDAETWSAEWDDPDSIRARLIRLPIELGTRVIVSWSADVALETSWRVFANNWSAFCYPSTDDVTVWASDQPWSICYRHFRVMQVRFPRTAI